MPRKPRIEDVVARRIRALREARGLSQAELSRLARTSRSQVALVESGERAPSVATLDRFAHALGVPLTDLVADHDGGRGANPPPDRANRIAVTLRHRGRDYMDAVEGLVRVLDRAIEARPKRRTKGSADGA